MQNRVSQVDGDYGFNIVNKVIDYKGDIARNNNRVDNQIIYSPDFSPNNIRRLILSGDGVRIDFHISVKGRKSQVKVFSDTDKMKILQSLQLPNYKPMIWALAERVCSSVEEVIICTQNSAGIDLSRELNFEGLLRNRVQTKDVKEAISSRYKRLAYFTIVNASITDLLKDNEVSSCNSPLKLITETEFVKSCGTTTKFKDDWYNYYGHTSVYSLDNSGSPLNEHFKKIKTDIEEARKKSSIDSIKAERLKGVSDKFERAFKNYRGIVTCINRLSVIVRTEGTCYFADNITKEINIGSYKTPDSIKDEFETLKSRDECEQYVSELIKLTSSLYSVLVEWFLNGLLTINKEYPLTLKFFLDTIDRALTIPPNCESLKNSLGVDFKGVSLVDSTSNICAYACSIFITDEGEHNMSKYYKKDTWLSNFEGGAK